MGNLLIQPVFTPAAISNSLFQTVRAVAGFSDEEPITSSVIKTALGPVQFKQAAPVFGPRDVSIRRGENSFLTVQFRGALSSVGFFDHVVSQRALLKNPELVKDLRYILIPAEVGFFKSALEFCQAAQMHRPIIGGIEDPTGEEIRIFLENEKNGSLWQRFLNLYFFSKPFERSGKIYEKIGVRAFRDYLVRPIGKVTTTVTETLLRGFLHFVSRGALTEEVDKVLKGKLYSTNYFIGAIRTFGTLRIFEHETRKNESPHALISVGCLPAVSAMLYFNYAGDSTATHFATLLLYLANFYAALLQRYNRARVINTIDLKLGRGPFENVVPR